MNEAALTMQYVRYVQDYKFALPERGTQGASSIYIVCTRGANLTYTQVDLPESTKKEYNKNVCK